MQTEELQMLTSLSQEDHALVCTLVQLFCEQKPVFEQHLETTIATHDYTTLKGHAHTYKGVVLNLGFNTLGEALKELEAAAIEEDFAACARLLVDIRQNGTDITQQLKELGWCAR